MRLRILVMAMLLFSGFFVASELPATAATTTIVPEKIARIRARCVENQAALNRLQKTDAFLRNDRGNLYRTISDKLMVPLNRRLAANQLDAGPLLKIAADYNREYSTFYDAYVGYDNALSKVRDIDCDREPVAFYNALLDTREKREKLASTNLAIKEFIQQYGVSFTTFKTDYDKANP